MNKQNRKIKKGILLATIVAIIGIGFWVGKAAEPLKAETKTEQKVVSDSKSEATDDRALETDKTKAPESDDETTDVAPTIEEATADTKSSEPEAFDAMVTNGDFGLETPFILVSQIKGKDKTQILATLQEALRPSYTKDATIGAKIIDTNVTSTSRGSFGGPKVTVQRADGIGDSKDIKVFITPDAIWEGTDQYGWKNLKAGSDEGVIKNPINGSKAGFPGRGLNKEYVKNTQNNYRSPGLQLKYLAKSEWVSYASSASGVGYAVQDKSGIGYAGAGALVHDIVGIKKDGREGNPLYASSTSTAWYPKGSLAELGSKGGNPAPNSSITYAFDFRQAYFLKKGDEQGPLKQIFMDTGNKIIYVYNISLRPNLNFYVELQTYNVDTQEKAYGMLETSTTDYIAWGSEIYPLANNSGFYLSHYEPKETLRLALKLKDNQGNWLSDFSMYQAGTYHQTPLNLQDPIKYPYSGMGINLQNTGNNNIFGPDFTIPRQEVGEYNLSEPLVSDKAITQGGGGSAYELGAPYKNLKQDEALKTGYEVFVGDELPYMQIVADPNAWNIYPDEALSSGFNTDYTLSEIPVDDAYGPVTITFPDGTTKEEQFTGGTKINFNSSVTIPRNTLPANLVGSPGTKQSYFTSFLAINKKPGMFYGLPSNDYVVPINVYNLGFTPVPQVITQGTSWDKEITDLVSEPVIVPGHTPKYEYVDGKPVTKDWAEGVHMVAVRMTDENQPTRTVEIDVPFIVTASTIPADKEWLPFLSKNVLEQYNVGAAKPQSSEINDWFENNINFINLKTGKMYYSAGQGLLTNTFSVTLNTTWDSSKSGTFDYLATIKVNTPPSDLTGKLSSDTINLSGKQLQIEFTGGQPAIGGDITVEYYVDGSKKSSDTVKGGEVGTVATILAYSDAANYDFDKAILPDGETVTTWSALTNKVKFTAASQIVKVYYKTKPVTTGGAIKVHYYVDDNYKSTETVPGGTIGSTATIPNPTTYKDYGFQKALLTSADGQTIKETFNTWPTTVKFTPEEQAVYIYYVTKVTVKVTMVNEAGKPISFPEGTKEPLTLYDSSTVFATDSSVSGSTITFGTKIKKGAFYRIGQNTAIDGYLKYDQDPKAGENQTPKIGVSTDNKAEFSGHEKPPTEKDGWIVYLGVSLKYDASNSTLNVKITNKTATVYQLSVDTQTIDLWAGDPIRTPTELKEIFRGHIKAVEDKTPVSPGIELSDSQYSLEITSNWVNTVTPVGSPRSFTVKVTPTQAAINEYPGLATLSGEYLKVNFKEITYELKATGVPHEYWSNDPQPNADERLTWVKDVKILPSNTPDTTNTTATKVEITGFKDGGTTKPTTEVDMTKLGETIYLVTVTAKNPLNKDTEITRENVEVPITIVAPLTYQLKINVVDTDGKPINYKDVSAPFGYTLADQKDWQTESTVADNTITFTKGLNIQSKYQIEQSKVLPPNKSDQIDTKMEHDDPLAGVFPPGSAPAQKDVQELHTKKLTETYPWNNQDPSKSLMISRDETTLSYDSTKYETNTVDPILLTDGLKAQYDKANRVLTLTVTNVQGELSLAVPDLIFEQGTPGILKDQVLGRKKFKVAGEESPWKVQIKDTLQGTKGWSLEAKLIKPFTLTGENREIKDILIYKDQPNSEQQLMVLNQGINILDKDTAGDPNAQQFYEKTWDPQAGFLLSVDKQKSMGIKGGVYTAALEFTLKDAD